MKIGVISDTHGLVRPGVIKKLKGCELILHAGDINNQMVLDELGRIAPVKVVRGNNDHDWASHIPYLLDFEYGGIKICMAHMKKDLPSDLTPYNLVVLGHTHKYAESIQGNILVLNPGSCGPRRFGQDITMAILDVKDGQIQVTRVDIPHEQI